MTKSLIIWITIFSCHYRRRRVDLSGDTLQSTSPPVHRPRRVRHLDRPRSLSTLGTGDGSTTPPLEYEGPCWCRRVGVETWGPRDMRGPWPFWDRGIRVFTDEGEGQGSRVRSRLVSTPTRVRDDVGRSTRTRTHRDYVVGGRRSGGEDWNPRLLTLPSVVPTPSESCPDVHGEP